MNYEMIRGNMLRLDKFLSEAKIGSRSEVKKIIASGRVSADGAVIKDPAFKVSEDSTVFIGKEPVRYVKYEYYMLNKPKGVISAGKDESGNICAADLISEKIRDDLFPVGRLDKDTEGLLLITNDGDLAHRLLSPKKHVDKKYFVRLDGVPDEAAVRRLMEGVDIGDEKTTLPCKIERLSPDSFHITIHEGRYHQIKRMFKTEGLTVTELKRLAMGPLTLDPSLEPGQWRPLTAEELLALKSCR